jgi:hypothetical protein
METDTRDMQMVGGAIGKLAEWDRATAKSFPSVVPQWLGGPAGFWSNAPYPAGEDPMGSDYSRRQFYSSDYWRGLGREGASAESAARLRREAERFGAASPFAVPGLSKTMTYGTGAESATSVAVEGTMQGEGKLAIDVNAGSSLIEVVRRAEAAIQLVGHISSNGVGSTGKSSPDAAAPSHVGSAGHMPL